MSTILRRSLPVALLLVTTSSVLATTRSVRPDGLGTYPTIQAAVNAAFPADQVVLLSGTFRGTGNCNVDLKGKAITIRSTNPTDLATVAATIIDCQGDPYGSDPTHYVRGFLCAAGETSATVLSGLTIINGQTINGMRYWPPDADDRKGGGVYCNGASPTIRNCVFRNCRGTYGAAIYGTAGQLLIENCTFTDCWGFSDWGWGPGSSVNCADSVIRNCTFSGSDIGIAGTSTISGCTVSGAGGIQSSGELTLVNCTISGNCSSSMNGRAAGLDLAGTASITNCVIDGNSASSWDPPYDYDVWGAGVSFGGTSLTITNSRITHNHCSGSGSAKGYGAGLLVHGGSVSLTGCTIADNAADIGSGIYASGNVTLRNCIVWANGTNPSGMSGSATFTAIYSDIQGGLAGTGNIDADPHFTTGYHLDEDSPCANTGDPAYAPASGETDLDGDPRVLYNVVDMGSDEHRAACDFGNDGQVNVLDLLVFSDAWSTKTGDARYNPACDLNHSGSVNITDLLILAGYFH